MLSQDSAELSGQIDSCLNNRAIPGLKATVAKKFIADLNLCLVRISERLTLTTCVCILGAFGNTPGNCCIAAA